MQRDIKVEMPEHGLYVEAVVYHDPGCRTLRNGDPGYPPSTSVEEYTVYATQDGVTVKLDDDVAGVLFTHYDMQHKLMEAFNE